MNSKKLLLTVGVLLGLLVWGQASGTVPLASGGYHLVRPIGEKLSQWGQGLAFGLANLSNSHTLGVENKNLREELARTQAELASLQALEAENQALKEQLSFNSENKFETVAANVVGFELDSSFRLVRINKGSAENLAVGDSVLWSGYLVGTVKDVYKNYANVLLVNDLRFRALTEGARHGATGIIKGNLGAGLTMERIPPTEDLEAGELVYTSGLDGEFPKGIPLGKVVSVSHPEGNVFKVAQIRVFFEPSDLETLFVVRAR